jgi:hypothetical protein
MRTDVRHPNNTIHIYLFYHLKNNPIGSYPHSHGTFPLALHRADVQMSSRLVSIHKLSYCSDDLLRSVRRDALQGFLGAFVKI